MTTRARPQPDAPEPAPREACANCGAPLYGKYCYACGQPVRGLVRHFGSVMSDVVDSVFNVDERLFSTIGPLYLRPGKLTLDYFAGRRTRYVTPFRLVFFLAIAAFFAFQLSVRTGLTQAVPVAVSAGTDGVSVTPKDKGGRQDHGTFSDGSIRLNNHVLWNRQTKPLEVGWFPGAVNAWLNSLIGNAQQRLDQMNSGPRETRKVAQNRLILGMFSAAPTVLFVLLPVFALLLKVFYIFKRRLYMEHLIVAMHSQAFLLLSMLVMLALSLLRAWATPHVAWLKVPFDLLLAAAWVWLFVYLFVMQKRVYRQGWFMTCVKYWCIGWCYTILIGFGWLFAVLISLTGA